jgi:hypothetical protein
MHDPVKVKRRIYFRGCATSFVDAMKASIDF